MFTLFEVNRKQNPTKGIIKIKPNIFVLSDLPILPDNFWYVVGPSIVFWVNRVTDYINAQIYLPR